MRKQITIDSVNGGIAQSQYFAGKGQYSVGVGIDPDMPTDETSVRSSGFLRPTSMAKFSGTEVTGVPLWFVTNPKTANTYLYANDGKIHTIDFSLAMGTALNAGAALASSSGNGAEYYDNYILFATQTNMVAYGPLNGTPALITSRWTNGSYTGTSGGYGLSALTNTTYPSIRGVQMPNHAMHNDLESGRLFVCDVVGTPTADINRGCLHQVSTTKTTVEGDTLDTGNPTTYNVIDFDWGFYPSCLASYNADLAVGLFEGTDTTIKQRNAKVAFWDKSAVAPHSIVELPDPLITAMKNVNGQLYVFSGNASGGCRVSVFAGGYTFRELYYDEDGTPPLAGAVDALLYKILWGGSTTDPATYAVVKSLGSKRAGFMRADAMHIPYKASSSGATPTVTALKYIQHSSFIKPQPIIGWSDGSAKGLDKASTTYGTSIFRSEIFRVGVPFQIVSVSIPLKNTLTTNMYVQPRLLLDDKTTTFQIQGISSANFPTATRRVVQHPTGCGGNNDFLLELEYSGSVLLTVSLPIIIVIDTLEDETT